VLHLHRAERPDHLLAALSDVLEATLPDPLATEVVAVHSRGIERWIAQELSLRLGTADDRTDGVCANVAFPFPGRLIRTAVAAGSGVDPDDDPWLPQRLVWPLLELLEERAGDPALGPLGIYARAGAPDRGGRDGEADQQVERRARRFGAVRHVADLFDQYGVHRPEMLEAWAAGDDVGPDGGPLPVRYRWQAHVWRAARLRVGLPSFAERHRRARERLEQEPSLIDLPPRLSLFGLTSLPASYLAVLNAIARHREVHLLLLHPSTELWCRVETATSGMLGLLWPRDDDPTAHLPRNPLLASWGRDARELQLVAPAPTEPSARHAHTGPDPAPTTLLERLQADVRADRAPGDRGDLPALETGDRSVQIHDCHGRLRQVEVLRDAVLHLLAEDEALEPRDIIVMCPDIETFAPLVTAVFGARAVTHDGSDASQLAQSDGTPPPLRVRLADRSLRRTNPVLEVVSQLLDLVGGRLTASSVLDLVSRAPVRRRFAFTDDDIELIESWVADLGIRWGIDGEHRRAHGLPALDAYTWRRGLERLQLGMAMADEDLRLIAGVAPYDGVEGRTSDLAGRLVELIERMGCALDAMRGPQTVEGWRGTIGTAADALTLTDAESSWQRLQLHRVLDDLVDEATSADTPSSVELALPEARSLLAERLSGRPTTTGHRTGDLTVCTLVPMRSVPHRVVCLLGLDDGAFPRQTVPDADDLLLRAPRIGDRDLRSEDRQLLLDALLAAGRTLVITYAGRDVRTNEPRPPAVPVDELLDTIDRTVRTSDGRRPREHITVHHPLAAHDPRNFEPGTLDRGDRSWSFDPSSLEAAEARRSTLRPSRPFLAERLPDVSEDVLDLDDLVSFFQHPVRAVVRRRLEVRFPGEADEVSDSIPASLRGLDAWRVGDAIVQAWLRGDDTERAIDVSRGRGAVPPGDLAGDDLDSVRSRSQRIIDLSTRIGIEPGPRRTVDVEVGLHDGRVLVGTVPDIAEWRLETIGYGTVAPKHRLASWVRLLAVLAQEPQHPWTAVTAGRHPWKGDRAQAVLLGPFDGSEEEVRDVARERLGGVVELFDRGMRAPIPLYCATSAKIAENLRRDEDPRRFVDKEWETGPFDPFDREDRDPYHQLTLGGLVTTDDLFAEPVTDDAEASWSPDHRRVVAYAWHLWEPVLEAERRCEA
jgi:exodeoxyribonuclease V gamma subunit